MQKLAEICIHRPVFAAMIILALVVVGAASYFRLGVDRFPSVDLPTVSVRTTLPRRLHRGDRDPGLPADRGGRQHRRGHRGAALDLRPAPAIVIATFSLNRDIDAAAQDVRDRVATAVRNLPRDCGRR